MALGDSGDKEGPVKFSHGGVGDMQETIPIEEHQCMIVPGENRNDVLVTCCPVSTDDVS